MDTVAKIEMVITGDAKWSKYSQFDRNLKWNLNNSLNIRANYLCVSSSHRNVKCGSLQCKDGDRQPSSVNGIDITNSKTTIGVKGVEYECKWVNKKTHLLWFPPKRTFNHKNWWTLFSYTQSDKWTGSSTWLYWRRFSARWFTMRKRFGVCKSIVCQYISVHRSNEMPNER